MSGFEENYWNKLLVRRAFLLVGLLLAGLLTAAAQTTSFTYQGRLTDNNQAASGQYDLQFRLTDASGTTVAGTTPQVVNDVDVVSGVFSVELDFGASAFDGSERFLELGVRPGISTGAFTVLNPRQRLTSAPYAIRSQNPGTNGLNTLIATTSEAAGANCATGGVKVQFGLDANTNGTLDPGEVNAALTRFVCNGAQGPQGAQGFPGSTGPQGPAGTLGAYGDGSAGILTVGAAQTLDLSTALGISQLPAGLNLQFTDITITGSLTVPSGTILRATGNVTVTGTINVLPGASDSGVFRPNPGIGLTAASNPTAAAGINQGQVVNLIKLPLAGGGAGARNTSNSGGDGGGSFSIRARGNINIASGGLISANGTNAVNASTAGQGIVGGGGGAGGVIVLMAKGTVTVAGTVRANGGNGASGFDGNGGNSEGGGGGGGGGVALIVASAAPSVTGSIQVNGGPGGSNAGVSATINAGGGGGAGGGAGGVGGSTTTIASAGSVGISVQIVAATPENLVF